MQNSIRKLFLSIVIVFLFLPELYPQISFTQFKINGSSVTRLLYSGEKTFYVSVNSYLIRTTNNFRTWDTLYHYANSAFYIAVDTINEPANKIIVYSSDTSKPHLISLDGGKIWNPINTKRSNYIFSSLGIYSFGSSTLWQSTDYGTSWNAIQGPLGYGDYSRFCVDSYGNIYLKTMKDQALPEYHWHYLLKSTNNGINWNKIVEESAPGLFTWSQQMVLGYIIISTSSHGKTHFYNTRTSELKTYDLNSNMASIDLNGVIYLLNSALAPELRTIKSSSDLGVTWNTYKIDYPFGDYISDLFLDKYGYMYSGEQTFYNYYVKSQKYLYNYISSGSIIFANTTVQDTSYKKVTVYNPLTGPLSLDSVVAGNSAFFVNNFSKYAIPPHDSVIVEFGFSPQDTLASSTNVILYLEEMAIQVKLNGKGIATSIQEFNKDFTYKLSQNYPNPWNPTTIIKYSLPYASRVVLKIYNSLGQEVALLKNEIESSGNYQVEFNSKQLSSGIYFYRLYAESMVGKQQFSSSKKMILLK